MDPKTKKRGRVNPRVAVLACQKGKGGLCIIGGEGKGMKLERERKYTEKRNHEEKYMEGMCSGEGKRKRERNE